MATVKTAVSLRKDLFEKLNQMADELNIPRSRVIALAFESFYRNYQAQKMLDQLNAVYDDEQEDELQLSHAHRAIQHSLDDGEW